MISIRETKRIRILAHSFREAVMDDKVKCACEHCSCMVDTASALERGGQYYCDESCADGHVTQASCGHDDCDCGEPAH
jgi:hypothetical protein